MSGDMEGKPKTPINGTITSYDPVDAVGRIVLDDGTELPFGQTSMQGREPVVGVVVRVTEISKHPLGGWKAQVVKIPEGSSDDYLRALSNRDQKLAKQRPESHSPKIKDESEPLTPEEQRELEEHRAIQVAAAKEREAESVRARLRAWESMDSEPMSEQSAQHRAKKLLESNGIDSAVQLARHATTTMRFATFSGETSLGESRIGGLPDVSNSFEWPRFRKTPLAFLLQLNLAEISEYFGDSILPNAGRLLFFFEADEQQWGFDPQDKGVWRVIYDESPDIAPRNPPSDLQDGSFPQAKVKYYKSPSMPSPRSDAQYQRLGLTDEEQGNRYWDFFAKLDAVDTRHQILGDPDPIQSDMELECQLASNGINVGEAEGYETPEAIKLAPGSKDWVLLLQLDSDDTTAMNWGDWGRLYFWIREDDLSHYKFNDVWMILQCY